MSGTGSNESGPTDGMTPFNDFRAVPASHIESTENNVAESHQYYHGPTQGSNGDEVSDISDYSEHDDASRSRSHSHSHSNSQGRGSFEDGAEVTVVSDEQHQLERAGFSSHGMTGAEIIRGRSSRRPSETSRTSSGVRIVGSLPRIQSGMSGGSSMRVDPENWLSMRNGSFSQLSSHGGTVNNTPMSGQPGNQPLTRDNGFSQPYSRGEDAYYPGGGRGFSSMYQDAVSRRIASSSLRHYQGSYRNRSPSHSSQQSQDTSHASPYYEPNGSWLRLRPQNHANFPYRSRFLQRQSQSVENYLPQQVQDQRYLQYRYNHADRDSNVSMSIQEGEEQYYSQASGSHNVMNHVEPGCNQGFQEDLNEDNESGTDYPPQTEDHTGDPIADEDSERVSEDEETHTEFKPIESTENIDHKVYIANTSLTLDSVGINNQDVIRETSEREMLHNDDIENIDQTAASTQRNPAIPQNRGSINTSSEDMQWASPDSKYDRYHCRVDREQGDKAVEIPLFLFQRPHMRGFHYAWMSFFVAFFTWFALAPLLGEIKNSLELSHEQVWLSNVFSSAGTVVCRIIAGPLCDRFGARFVMAATLVIAAIPVMCTGLVHSAVELYIVRLVTGVAGASFVVTQYWTSCMFTREIAGTANSLVAGWGNLGGGLTQIVMGSALFPLFKFMYKGSSDDEQEVADRAWRIVFIIPAFLSILMAILVIKYSDDSPKGNYRKLKRLGLMPSIQAMKALRKASSEINTWLLFVHYGCCFGVEVTMTAGLALYFIERFDQTTESAAALASIFGWMNLFARGLGGFISDIMNVKSGMRGRLLWQSATMVAEGCSVIAFSKMQSLAGAIGMMVVFSLFVQTTEGSTYSIIPYVCPSATGSVAGIVGAGGNVGGVIFLLLIQRYSYEKGFVIMGFAVICSTALSFFMVFDGHAGLLCGSDANEVMAIRIQKNNVDGAEAAQAAETNITQKDDTNQTLALRSAVSNE